MGRAASPACQLPLSRAYPRRDDCSPPTLQSCRAAIGIFNPLSSSLSSSKLLFKTSYVLLHYIFTVHFHKLILSGLGDLHREDPAGPLLFCPHHSSELVRERLDNGQGKADDVVRTVGSSHVGWEG